MTKNDKKKGMSLIDVIISISIFSIGVLGFTLLFSKSISTNSFVLEEGSSITSATRALNSIIKDLRKTRQADNGNYMISSADDFDLTVYMNVDADSDTERVHYYLENESLKKGITNPTGNPAVYPPVYDEVIVLANYVTNTPAQPLFSYYNENYPGDTVNNPLITPVSVGDIKLIKVSIWINIKPQTAPDNVQFESFVNLRNLNEYNE